jgi:short-subunit dehydrogenase
MRSMAGFERAIVVGGTSGIGAALADRLERAGGRVARVGRRSAAYPHDVRRTDEVPDLFGRIERDLGGVDLVVYAAGLLHRVRPDEFDAAKDREMIDVNFTGAVAWLGEAARRLAEAGPSPGGTIVGIGSIAGDRGRRGNPVYGATKAALERYLESLRNRLAGRGVKVVTVKPGFVATPMTDGVPGMFWVVSADRAAEIILANVRRGREVFYVPARWAAVGAVVRAIPSFVLKRLPI